METRTVLRLVFGALLCTVTMMWFGISPAPATLAPSQPGARALSTPAPSSVSPATSAPATSAPATSAPATSAPATSAPATSAPATSAPATSAPATSATSASSAGIETAARPATTAERGLVLFFGHERPSEARNQYVKSAFVYNALYVKQHGIQMKYMTLAGEPYDRYDHLRDPDSCFTKDRDFCYMPAWGQSVCSKRFCVGPNGCLLHPAWCKIKATLYAMDHLDPGWVLPMDLDSVFRFDGFGASVEKVIPTMLDSMGVDFEATPFVASQEGAGYWCDIKLPVEITNKTGFKIRWCLNSGVNIVKGTALGRRAVHAWWKSSMDDVASNPLGYHFRLDHPWEQDRLHYITSLDTHEAYGLFTAIPKPDEFYMGTPHDYKDATDLCFSNHPWYRCTVNHFFGDVHTKTYWGNRSMHMAASLLHGCAIRNKTVRIHHPEGEHSLGAIPQNEFDMEFPLDFCDDELAGLDVPLPPDNPVFGFQNENYSVVFEWESYMEAAVGVLEPRHILVLPDDYGPDDSANIPPPP